MSPYGFIRTARWMIYLGVFYLVGVLFILIFLAGEIRKEVSFHKEYGEHWKENYEKYWGSLSQAHIRMAVAILALALISGIVAWFFWQAEGTNPKRSRRR
jgi:hypothetical protein